MTDAASHAHSTSQPGSNDAISSISAIAYGFMGSQALFAALELGLFTALAEEPCDLVSRGRPSASTPAVGSPPDLHRPGKKSTGPAPRDREAGTRDAAHSGNSVPSDVQNPCRRIAGAETAEQDSCCRHRGRGSPT